MPLAVYERDENGALLQDKIKEDTPYPMLALPLKNEMNQLDTLIPWQDWKKYPLPSKKFDKRFLKPVFDYSVNGPVWDKKFDAYKTELADFLNTQTTGPYYVQENNLDMGLTLSIIFLEKVDIKAFSKQYPDWEFDKDAIQHNQGRLQEWSEAGWKPQSENVKSYIKPVAAL
jgi:hypothetical protein